MPSDTQILLHIQEQIGELHKVIGSVKATGEKGLAQAEKTNGRVTRLENIVIPDIRNILEERKDDITEVKENFTAMTNNKYDDCPNKNVIKELDSFMARSKTTITNRAKHLLTIASITVIGASVVGMLSAFDLI